MQEERAPHTEEIPPKPEDSSAEHSRDLCLLVKIIHDNFCIFVWPYLKFIGDKAIQTALCTDPGQF